MSIVEQQLNEKITFLENALNTDLLDDPGFDIGEFEDVVRDMEIEMKYDGRGWTAEEQVKVDRILSLIKKVKDEYDIYDAEAERGFMFPDGEDDDF